VKVNLFEMKTIVSISGLAFLISILLTSVNAKAQVAPSNPDPKSLNHTIGDLDSVMFTAFNTRDIGTLRRLFAKDIEFYHDEGGLTNYEQNMRSFEETFKSERTVRRALVKGSVEVSPIKGYGAVQTGVHRFYATEKGRKEVLSSEAKFVTLWRFKDGVWEATKIISYLHQEYLK
jgi:hypothetical protein